MGEGEFDDPQRVAINRVYTRKGDAGETGLVGGQRVAKDHPRIQAYGAIDELNAFVGVARRTLLDGADDRLRPLADTLLRVQHQLFNLGSVLATEPGDLHPRQPRVRPEDVAWLESEIDAANALLGPLRSFVLPGGTRACAELHVCRTVCRRAEQLVCALARTEAVDVETMAYVNRLSDAFFVWSRAADALVGAAEILWDPNAADGS